MTAIQLTEKQKEMLLEMCNKLFPEYHNIYFRIDSKSSTIYPDDSFIDNNILRIGSFGKLDLSIHWFEFCMTHLQDKIKSLNGFNDDYDCDSNLMSCWFESQPVDYLYEVFKKLK